MRPNAETGFWNAFATPVLHIRRPVVEAHDGAIAGVAGSPGVHEEQFGLGIGTRCQLALMHYQPLFDHPH